VNRTNPIRFYEYVGYSKLNKVLFLWDNKTNTWPKQDD